MKSKIISWHFYAVIILITSSCSDLKYITSGNKYYQGVEDKAGDVHLVRNVVKKGFLAEITEKEGYIKIKPISEPVLDKETIKTYTRRPADQKIGIYFPELDNDPKASASDKLIYVDQKLVLQAMSVPIKIRPAIRDLQLKDSFPSQVETGFSVALALGYKISRNAYRASKNILGQTTDRISITPGVFLGTGAADLKKSNTRNPVISFERKAAIVSTGGFLMFGFNNINIGYTAGIDYATGVGHEGWLYKGKLWHGVSVGLDIIK